MKLNKIKETMLKRLAKRDTRWGALTANEKGMTKRLAAIELLDSGLIEQLGLGQKSTCRITSAGREALAALDKEE